MKLILLKISKGEIYKNIYGAPIVKLMLLQISKRRKVKKLSNSCWAPTSKRILFYVSKRRIF